MRQWYEEVFRNYANKYEEEPFTKGTIGEVDFIEKEIGFNKNTRILDIGCGTGRHSVELAKRGYYVVGIDLSMNMLNKARFNAKKEKVNVQFIQADARQLNFDNEFNLVIMLCEGAFPLMETDKMNFEILKNASNALVDKGKFIFTTLNGLYPLFHSVKDFINSHCERDASKEDTFDLMTFRNIWDYEHIDDDGNKKTVKCNERYYVPSEIIWLLKTLGFLKTEIFGCEIGCWSRERKLITEDFEMLVVAEKS